MVQADSGSQFFITTDVAPHLDGKHVVFGTVLKGFNDVIKSIEKVLRLRTRTALLRCASHGELTRCVRDARARARTHTHTQVGSGSGHPSSPVVISDCGVVAE